MSVIKDKENNRITLILDQKELKEYLEYYFRKYPRRRVAPLDNPVHPSINKWVGNNHHKRNADKIAWNDFIIWYLERYNLTSCQIQECHMTCILTFPTKHRRDPDNYTHKFINDGLVEGGFLIDDSFENIKEVTYVKKYEKGVYKTEIVVDILHMEGSF